MRQHKLALFTMLLPLTLTACNSSSIAGVYYFQLGKDTGTHFGIYLKLTDTIYVPADGDSSLGEEKFKDFILSGSVKFPEQEDGQDMGETLSKIFEYFPDGLKGYYRRSGKMNPHGEEILKLGISFTYVISKINEIIEQEGGSEIVIPEDVDKLNNNSVIQKLLYATYKNEAVNIYIPVSIEDVYYQLYWYGIDVKIDILNLSIDLVDVTPHDLGTHPTKEEVEEINLTFKEEHQGCYVTTFRDYNNLKMGLSKR